MFVFDIASHHPVAALPWSASGSSASRAPNKASTRASDARAYRVADAVAELMDLGVLRGGDKLPSERQLAALLDISRDAVRVALDVLQQRHMLKKRHGARTELCGAAIETREPVALAATCLALEAAIDARPRAGNAVATKPLVADLIQLATVHARGAADAEALVVCRRLAAAHGVGRRHDD